MSQRREVDGDFVAEQTDLALLVREDTRLFLRSSDLEEGGSDEELYLHDAERGVVAAPKRSLALEGLHPTLEGQSQATPIPSPPKPVEPAGDQYQMRPTVICVQPSHTDRDARAEVEPV